MSVKGLLGKAAIAAGIDIEPGVIVRGKRAGRLQQSGIQRPAQSAENRDRAGRTLPAASGLPQSQNRGMAQYGSKPTRH